MKKKIIFGIAASLFFVATMFSFNVSQQSNISDISLINIAVMSQANAEITPNCPTGCYTNGNGCTCGTYYPTYKPA